MICTCVFAPLVKLLDSSRTGNFGSPWLYPAKHFPLSMCHSCYHLIGILNQIDWLLKSASSSAVSSAKSWVCLLVICFSKIKQWDLTIEQSMRRSLKSPCTHGWCAVYPLFGNHWPSLHLSHVPVTGTWSSLLSCSVGRQASSLSWLWGWEMIRAVWPAWRCVFGEFTILFRAWTFLEASPLC